MGNENKKLYSESEIGCLLLGIYTKEITPENKAYPLHKHTRQNNHQLQTGLFKHSNNSNKGKHFSIASKQGPPPTTILGCRQPSESHDHPFLHAHAHHSLAHLHLYLCPFHIQHLYK